MSKTPSSSKNTSSESLRSEIISELLPDNLNLLARWEARWPPFDTDDTLFVSADRAREVLAELLERLQHNYPFFHPCYAGQMLKPPHLIASLAYFLTQQINPNNHALDGGPATAEMEQECVSHLAAMFGFDPYLGHLTSSGTIANLEALWVARSIHPKQAIAFSSEAHYTHQRMCEVIGASGIVIAADDRGRIDLDDLRAKLKTGQIGTVVMTAGTTALGAIDPIETALELQREFGFRIHVDAAYGGFYKLLAHEKTDQANSPDMLAAEDAKAFRAIAQCDSVVVDPHKHGLQPYGCGAVLFRDPAVGQFYKHDSPYTYFTSDEIHLGEISLECSRAGAAAAALWATLRCFPLAAEGGLAAILRKTRGAALRWAELINESEQLRLVVEPSLDIIAFFAATDDKSASGISALTHQLFAELMNAPSDPVYLAKLHLKPSLLARYTDIVWDQPVLTVLRSCLMKPEHFNHVPHLHERVLAQFKSQTKDNPIK
jgi:glutamate/tyrosine decarboxylase-like PLP-dependent enzyme